MITVNRNSVRATTSPTSGGTQSDELQAKIKSVTSSTTVGSCFIYDTRSMDSDGGAWRKKCAGLSWYDEDLNTATRGGRREFPSVALIVADNGGTSNVTIYDLDDPAMPMWMVINRGNGHILFGADMGSVFALNGRLYVGHNVASGALSEISFADDFGFVRIHNTSAYNGATIADREVATSDTVTGTTGALVSRTVNDVAATIVEGAEIGALGLPIPTVAVATGGGVSVIHPNGSVYDFKDSTATNRSYSDVRFRESGHIFAWSSMNGTAHSWYAHQLYSDHSAASDLFKYDEGDNANLPNLLSDSTQTIAVGKGSVFTGGSNGLSIVKENLANPAEGASAHITSEYNTGYMLGDIRFAGLANAASADRSVKGNTLNHNGSVLNQDVATNAELQAYYDFSTSNYLSKDLTSDTDFDFGTGDFSVMVWLKTSDTTRQTVFQCYGSGSLYFQMQQMETAVNSGEFRFQMADGGGAIYATSTSNYDGNWHQVVGVRDGDVLRVYVDGKLAGTQTGAASMDFDSGSTTLYVGRQFGGSSNAFDGSLSLLRFSATAPTPQQVKDIYEAERPLFRAGAKCLLQSNFSSPNDVLALSYDKQTNLLLAGQYGAASDDGVTVFRGLEVVDTFKGSDHGWSSNSTLLLHSAGGVNAYGRTSATGGVLVDLPAIDVRGDLNTADTKLPDDGKFHFSGVTTNATPTVIGQIPIAENESYTVIARVMGLRYNTADSSVRHFCEIKQQFTRRVGGDVVEETQISKLEEGDWAALDVDLDYDTGADTIRVKVTGDGSGPYRVVWKADVVVQRISEKQYER